ncbi:hypothetical protein COLO4_00042 [Corchorus olitorius]|uniref:Uncharacterized protein n=1 Tax=Corchorus olitorius TaxID=93759 RepID=A0A1R3L4R7_9ROSI|nr:hypothetical protein COLO4_00042 [Corchorus olitorius]
MRWGKAAVMVKMVARVSINFGEERKKKKVLVFIPTHQTRPDPIRINPSKPTSPFGYNF